MTRNNLVPETVWGHVDTIEETEQTIGCYKCLLSGVYDPPSMVYFINGTTLCRTHVQGDTHAGTRP